MKRKLFGQVALGVWMSTFAFAAFAQLNQATEGWFYLDDPSQTIPVETPLCSDEQPETCAQLYILDEDDQWVPKKDSNGNNIYAYGERL